MKGYTKQRHDKRLPVSKHVILEDDELSEHTDHDLQSGIEIAAMLCNMSPEKLLEVVQKIVRLVCCRSSCRTLLFLLRQLWFQFQQVPVGSASRLRSGNQAKKACSFNVSVFGSHVSPGSAKTDSFLCPPPTSSLTGVVAGTGTAQSGAPVVFSPGSSSLSSAAVRGNLFVSAGILDGCLTELKGAEIDGVAGTAGMQAGSSPPLPPL